MLQGNTKFSLPLKRQGTLFLVRGRVLNEELFSVVSFLSFYWQGIFLSWMVTENCFVIRQWKVGECFLSLGVVTMRKGWPF